MDFSRYYFFPWTLTGVIGRYPLQLMGLLMWIVSLLRVRFDLLLVYSSYNLFLAENIKECLQQLRYISYNGRSINIVCPEIYIYICIYICLDNPPHIIQCNVIWHNICILHEHSYIKRY